MAKTDKRQGNGVIHRNLIEFQGLDVFVMFCLKFYITCMCWM